MEEKAEFIGGYQLRNLIATGQSSQVWEVVEPSSKRHFAMKMLLPEAATNPATKKLLVHEAEVGLKLQHPNIIKIVKVVKEGKTPFFVMEFFPAGSMQFRIINKQFDFIKEYAVTIFKQIATALAYMNSSGWIHRDVKPDNMLANSLGESKLIDFAISCRAHQKRSFLAAFFFGQKAKVMGTRSYMSPEQIRDEPLDARADVYSFGATVYEIVAGRPPFRGATSQDLLAKHLMEKPLPPKGINPDVTDDFSALTLRMLAKKPEDRPANFHEVLMAMKTMRIFKSQATPKAK